MNGMIWRLFKDPFDVTILWIGKSFGNVKTQTNLS